MAEILGFPKDIWSRLIYLNEEEPKIDWTLQKRNGSFKLSIFWKPKNEDIEVVNPQAPRANLAKSTVDKKTRSPWTCRENSSVNNIAISTKIQQKQQATLNNKLKKHKSPCVKKRDKARLEAWIKSRQSAQVSTIEKVQEQNQEPNPETSGTHKKEAPVGKKAPVAENTQHKEMLLAGIQRLQELKNNEPLSEPISTACPPEAMSDHSFDSVLRFSCFYCNKPGNEVIGGLKLCTRCRGASYCSKECQTKDWKLHRPICSPAKTNVIEKITASLQEELNKF